MSANSLRITGSIKLLQAAKGDTDGTPKPSTFQLVAYTGRPMRLNGFYYPMVVDCATLRFNKSKTAVIADHETAMRIGHTTSQAIVAAGATTQVNGKTIKGPLVYAEGVVSSTMGVARGFVDDARNGFPFECSIGADSEDLQLVLEDQTVEVNGRTHQGPIYVARNAVIYELSVTVNGADSNTSARVAASRRKRPMPFAQFLASLNLEQDKLSKKQLVALKAHWRTTIKASTGPDPAAPPAAETEEPAEDVDTDVDDTTAEPAAAPAAPAEGGEITAHRMRLADEERRVDRIRGISVELPRDEITYRGRKFTAQQFKEHAIRTNMSVETYELELRRASYSAPERVPAFHIADRSIDEQAMAASIMRAQNVPMRATNPRNGVVYGMETMFSEDILERSEQPQYRIGNSIQALFDLQIRAAGDYFAGSDRKSKDFFNQTVKSYHKIRAAGVSGLSVANVLENVMNKSALASFQAVEAVWSFICGRRPLNDFKAHSTYRLNWDGSFKKVGADGELKHISMSDEKQTVQADTYGAVVRIDYQTFKNDDLGMITAQANALGALAAFRIEESVFVLLLGNSGSFFSAGNKNLLTGGTSALSITSLDSARVLFRNQTINGKPLMVSPRLLVVGTGLETTAGHLYIEERLDATGNTDATVFVRNPHKGLYRPYVSPYVNNTDIKDQDGNTITGQSGTKWWLLGDPNSPFGAAVVIGFVDGREVPFFDEAETEFTMPQGMQFRSYLHWGVAFGTKQAGVQSNGA